MADDGGRPDLDELVDRFERVAHARAETGKLDAPAEVVLSEVQGVVPVPQLVERAPQIADPGGSEISPTADDSQPDEVPPELEIDVPLPAPENLEQWWIGGERIDLDLDGGRRYGIFARVLGDGPWLTTLHGFPTSSWDWAKVAPALAQKHRLLAFDLLGFGDSDKPAGHDWSAFEQADIVEALWRRFGVTETRLLAHDVGLTVALELLARHEEGKLAARVTGLVLLNGGAYAAFHRPRPIQVWLQRPVIGALIARMLSEQRFGPAFAEIFSPAHQPSAEEIHQHWQTVSRRGGSRSYHRLVRYIPERRANAARWEGAMERTALPIRFVWGAVDPVSGAHMASVIRERRPGADIVELDDVGHYPQLEAPERVIEATLV